MTGFLFRRINPLTLFLISFCLLFTSMAIECSAGSSTSELLDKADNSRKSLYRSTKRMKYRHNWMNTIGQYEKIYKKYPRSEEAPWAMFRAAGMYLGLNKYSGLEKDVNTALELYEKVTEDYPDHRLADDAQYRMGNIYYSYKKDMTQAYVEFLKVDIKYPSGDMRSRAKEMMNKLSSLIEDKNSEEITSDTDNASSEAGPTTVRDIRHWSTPTYTRVVIDLDKPAEYADHLLKKDPDLNKPRRLYLDLKNTRVGKDIESSIPIKDGLLRTARAGQYNADTVRVVLDIDNISGYKTFPLHDPFRIVVDVRGNKHSTDGGDKTNKSKPDKGLKPMIPDESISLARQLGLSVKRIVLDPGHGGKDPGCLFKGGIREKDITLALAKKLKIKIEKKLGCEVLLTRATDVFMPLDERTAFATLKNADLFISLHVNAHKQSHIYGIETYFLNMATDQQAVMVAARENATSEKNISDLQSILKDLMLTTKISESSKLAYMVQNGMITDVKRKYKPYKSLGVKQAPFYVLVGAEMPSILIETGFITNSTERSRLLSENYKDVLSEGIAIGIESYMKSIDQAYMGG
jgi:N-acetylmuramoyl-L-alanine amidase